MKSYLVAIGLLTSIGLSGVPGCGGKSEAYVDSNSGGKGGASSNGFAGQGAGPATHVTECEALCSRSEDAGCTGSNASCLMVCATVTGYPSCQKEIEAWLSCAKTGGITCDASGNPTVSGCDSQLMMVSACALMQDPPKAVAKSCTEFCKEVDRAGCSVNNQLGNCDQMCGIAGVVVSACQQKFVDYTNCQAAGGITCDGSGNPQAVGCEAQQLIYVGCLMTEVGQGTLSSSASGGSSSGAIN